MDRWRAVGRTICVSALLVAATFAAFWPALQNGFVHFDDPDYVVDNLHVQSGITSEGLAWAFTSGHAANWHPVTWISHMLDCMLFGLNPAGHHFTNLLLHAVNVVLLLLVMRKLTGEFWPSAIVAGLFALHPLRVESVAWVSERKDVLSGFFFLLTLMAYAAYTAKRDYPQNSPGKGAASPSQGRPKTGLFYYIAALLFFALGLMSKQMLMSLPFLLLLLDYWPLGRFKVRDTGMTTRLVLEKAPFLALAVLGGIIAVVVQGKGGTVVGLGLPLESRIANALISYSKYVLMFFWPAKLAFFYPHPAAANPALTQWITSASVFAILITCGFCVWVFLIRKRLPSVFVGWFWFFGMLVPVIGIVQLSGQALADRYTYLPSIGLALAVVWFIRETLPSPSAKLLAIASAPVLVGLAVASNRQTVSWRDDITLCARALAVTERNAVAHQNLGAALELKGDLDKAIEHYLRSADIDKSAEICFNLGNALLKQNRSSEAISWLRDGLNQRPTDVRGNQQLGLALMLNGHFAEAVAPLATVAEAFPSDAQAQFMLANALFESDRQIEAGHSYSRAANLDPTLYTKVLKQGQQLLDSGAIDLAQVRLLQATRLNPYDSQAFKLLGMLQARAGKLEDAIRNLELVTQLQLSAENQYNFAVVLSVAGQYSRAVATYKSALAIEPDYAPAANNLAWLLATHKDASMRDGQEALRLASRNVELHPGEPGYWGTLDAALAELGRWEDALQTAKRTRELAEKAGNQELARAAEKRLELYARHEPCRAVGPAGN